MSHVANGAMGLLWQINRALMRRMRSIYLVIPKALVSWCTLAICISLPAQTQNQIVGVGYDLAAPSVAARGQIITLLVRGANVPSAKASSVPLPTTLSGVAVRVTSQIPNYPQRLPILNIASSDPCGGGTASCALAYITVEIPTEPVCVPTGAVPNECVGVSNGSALLTVEVNGTAGQTFPLVITQSQPHIVNACDTISQAGGACYTLVQHADGTYVGTAGYPNGLLAKPGETITFYAVGLGPTNPLVPTGQASPASPPATIPGSALPLIVSYVLRLPPTSPDQPTVSAPVGRWIYPSYIGLVPGYVGLYQVNVTLPAELAQAQPAPGSGTCPLTARIAIGAGTGGAADGVSHVDVDVCVQH